MDQRLKDKIAIITGAGTGIGEAIAHKFAAEGANLVLNGYPDDPVEDVANTITEHHGVQAEVYLHDVAQEEHARGCVQKALDSFGRLDVLINNAGVFPEINETQEFSVDSFEHLLHNNVRSVFLMTKFALPELQKTGGNIVSAGSESGFNGQPMATAYGATKGWIHSFMKGVAAEQAKYGIRANCVCPGITDTAWTHKETSGMTEEMEEGFFRTIPLGRRGQPEEMANVYAFLASDEASYITGSLYLVDGGITIAKSPIGEKAPDELRQPPEQGFDTHHQHEGRTH